MGCYVAGPSALSIPDVRRWCSRACLPKGRSRVPDVSSTPAIYLRIHVPNMADQTTADLRFIRLWLVFFIVALFISGLTAVPLEWGTQWLANLSANWGEPWTSWTSDTATAVGYVGAHYPMLFYGTDWLAFAHIVIGLAFIGPYRDPARNRWVVEWGLWCCLLVIPLAFFWAPVRGIPFFWRCIDASFGVFGAIPLWLVLRRIDRLGKTSNA